MEDYKKKYEQALENIKKIKVANKSNKELVDFIEYKYPELRESEDEKIRKEIVEYIKIQQRVIKDEGHIQQANDIEKWIAWLEKQGKQEQLYIRFGETKIYLNDDGGEPPYDGKQWLDLSCTEGE